MEELTLLDFFDEFVNAFGLQLEEDQERWGNTWLNKRTIDGQEGRIRARFNDYFDAFEEGGTPVPWLKVIGNAYIAWVRETNPELFEE